MRASLLHTIMSFLFATIFLFAGTGYNIIQYCCHDCEVAGIEMAMKMSCDCIHHQHDHDMDNQTCHKNQSDTDTETCVSDLGKSCTIERLTVDVPLILMPNEVVVDYQLIYTDLGMLYTADLLSPTVELDKEQLYASSKTPIGQEGRQILSQISILII